MAHKHSSISGSHISLVKQLTEEMTKLNIMEHDCAIKRNTVAAIVQRLNKLLEESK